MKKVTKLNFRTLLVLFLSVVLCLSTALTVACDGKDSSSSSSSSVEEEEVYPTDTQTVINGDFEFSTFTKDNDDFPVGSSISWVRSSDSITSSAVSSSYTSGIINTEEDAYNEIASKAGFHKIVDSEEYFNPGTPFDIGAYEEGSYFVNEEDAVNEDKLVMYGSKILMIHNEVKGSDGKGNGEGTAQKFTSSTSLTLARHEYAKLTVWVMTHDLVSAYAATNEFGAYIAVQNTVSTSTTPLVIKNINTNSEWSKYTIYLASSDFATSSFKVVLGLGFGSKEIRREYVEGFAYFDNVNFETISKADYEAGIATVATEDNINIYDANNEVKDELIVNEFGKTYIDNAVENAANYTERVLALSHARANGTVDATVFGGTTTNNLGTTSTVTTQDLTDSSELVAPNGAVKALHVEHATPASTTYTTSAISIDEGQYLKLSFWVKAETQYPTDTSLTITLNDYGTDSTLALDPTKTVIASNTNTNDYEDENFNNWIEYVIFVSNTLDADSTNEHEIRYFTLTFDFGTTATSISNGNWDLTQGFFAVTEFEGYSLSETDYSIADVSSYAYAKKVSLSADRPNGVESEDETKDSYKVNHGLNDSNAIKNGPAANVIGYTGSIGGTTSVGGTADPANSDDNIIAGVVNSQYKDAYAADIKDALTDLGAIGENEFVQPLLIQAKADGMSFGYIGSAATLSAHTTTLISVKVKVTATAEAYIYLANSDALEAFNLLGVYLEEKKVENNELVATGKTLDKNYAIRVTAADMANAEDGWVTVRFVITTGDNSISYRPELWNGTRAGEAKAGIVLFDDYTVTTIADIDTFRDELRLDTGVDYSAGETEKVTRIPTLIKYTNDDGEEATKFKTYEETVVYEYHATISTMFVDLTTIDAITEIDNTDADTDADDETEDTTSDSSEETSFSWALQITSIIIASVLVALLIVVLVRMIVKKYRKNKGSSTNYYNRDSREKAGLAIEAKNARKAKEAEKEELVSADEEVKSYDYDNIENNIEEEVTEETAEEATEEVSEEATESTEEVTEESVSEEEKPEDNGENN